MPPSDVFAAATPSGAEREQLIIDHLPQVSLIARKMHKHIRGRIDLEDLVSAGILGLVAAIDRFDSSRELKLMTFAEYRIRGAMVDSLRSLDGVNRTDRTRAKQIENAAVSLSHRLHRTATREEIADEVGLTPLECSESLAAAAAGTPLSLDSRIDSSSQSPTFAEVTPDHDSASPEKAFVESEMHRAVSDAIAALPPIAKRVITMHYAHGLTMRKIAPILQMSEWQVQETRRKAVTELRKRLAPLGLIQSTP
jgi:RNA polymerase sigma factor for flagellar operon FliA